MSNMEHNSWFKQYNGHLNSPFFKTLKKWDWFEQTTTFKTTYTTAFGGCISILLYMGILGYWIYSCTIAFA